MTKDPTIESVTIVRGCRRYRMVPLVAFVKGHPKVVPRAANKLFDGGEKNTRQKKKTFEGLFYSVFGPFADHFLYLFFTLTISPFLSVRTPVPTLFIWPVPTPVPATLYFPLAATAATAALYSHHRRQTLKVQ